VIVTSTLSCGGTTPHYGEMERKGREGERNIDGNLLMIEREIK
jgi:hypothetical protein